MILVWALGIVLGGLVVLALLSPLESLRWWSQGGAVRTRRLLRAPVDDAPGVPMPQRYIVYLSGVGIIEQPASTEHEKGFIDALVALPGVAVVDDVFPYAPTGRGLLRGDTAWFWRRQLRQEQRGGFGFPAVQVRNILQVLVAADPRYGPTYYAGLAEQVWSGLRRRGYRRGCGVPVTLIGYSGGAQMSLGVAWFLSLLDASCSVISIGGVFSDDPGLDHVDHYWDLRGSRDLVRLAGPLAFPGRWPINRFSTWNEAKRDGRVTIVDAGPAIHYGPGDYFDPSARYPDGQTHAESLIALVTAIFAGPGHGNGAGPTMRPGPRGGSASGDH